MLWKTIPLVGLLALGLALGGAFPARAETPAKVQEHAAKKADDHSGTAAAPAEHASADEHKPSIVDRDAPLAIWTLIVFVGLVLILGKYAWKPLMKALDEREHHLQQVLLDSEKARNEAEAIAAENRKLLASASDQIRVMIDQATKDAQAIRDQALTKATAEADATRERAVKEIAGAKDQALMEIWSNTANLAVSVAGKVLSKEMGEADQRRLVEVALSELPTNGREGSRS